ncbi:MAG: hypothetical protein CVU39_22735 [Chloroflexi bacterium HGW-Chloroflexi-10]|nr:MAG: hypothetical protein CVU39_22735 [Chloroflexi bacterium HGW-Chloroflexi-10]
MISMQQLTIKDMIQYLHSQGWLLTECGMGMLSFHHPYQTYIAIALPTEENTTADVSEYLQSAMRTLGLFWGTNEGAVLYGQNIHREAVI